MLNLTHKLFKSAKIVELELKNTKKAYQIVFQPIDPFLLAKNANFYKKTPKHL